MIHNYMGLELVCLHRLHVQEVLHFRHEVLVHVQQNILYHDDHIFFEFPYFIHFFYEVLVFAGGQLLGDWLEHLNRGLAHVVVQHLAMLVEHQVVGGAVQLLVREL